MAHEPGNAFLATANLAENDSGLPIFDVQRVQLQFSIAANFVAAQVANNVLVLALSNGRILRIDLNRPEDIDDIDLPKRPSEVGVIERMFLDPTASHLLVCTALGETFYLHSQARQPRPLQRLRGVPITSVAWNPALPTVSTREIMVGAADGHVYETALEMSNEFYRKEDKYLRTLVRLSDGPVTGLWVDALPARSDSVHRVLASTPKRLLHWVGKVGRTAEGGPSIYSRLFETEQPVEHELDAANATTASGRTSVASTSASTSSSPSAAASTLVVSPDPDGSVPYEAVSNPDRVFAWLSEQGVFHGKLLVAPPRPELGSKVFAEAKLLTRAQFAAGPSAQPPANATSIAASASTWRQKNMGSGSGGGGGGGGGGGDDDTIEAIALTQWHVLGLLGGRVVAANRLTGAVVYDQAILEHPRQKALGMCVDVQKQTFWLFTPQEIFEVVVRDEDRDVWRIMLQLQQFDAALQYARTATQRDAVATASGDYLLRKGQFDAAAGVYGKSSSKPLEEVALALLDRQQPDALRKYLLAKLGTYSAKAVMQRTMLATWLVELFMAKLDALEDTVATRAELTTETAEGKATATGATSAAAAPAETVPTDATAPKAKGPMTQEQARAALESVREEFQAFVSKHTGDLDRKTVYEVIGSHGREVELLFFADTVNDYHYVLSYWVQREKWAEALGVLKRQTEPAVFYQYSGVLMVHVATELVDVLMRQGTQLQARSLIPALLAYDEHYSGPLRQNQAVRYLQFVVNTLHDDDVAVHNTLVALYAAHDPGGADETALLAYLEAQGDTPRYDPDFALRLCIQHRRVLSCVHIYTQMGQYVQAVDLALAHDAVDLAAVVADRPAGAALRKTLWLAVARKVIAQQGSGGIKAAIAFLKRCDLLKIEDLIPFFPDFVVIDDFKEDICAALEDYSRAIEGLRRDMDDSTATAAHIQDAVAALDRRYAIVEPGEKCAACGLPLLSRQFFVFPCQHAFHSDCLGRAVLEQASVAQGRRIRDLQVQITRGLAGNGAKKDQMVAELDALVASACILCSEFAIKKIDEPFVRPGEDKNEWSV